MENHDMTATTTTDTLFGDRARALRTKAGLSLIDLEIAIRTYNPELAPHTYSYGLVERIERGRKPEAEVDTVFLAILADIYGCPLAELSPVAAERAGSVVKLFGVKADKGFNTRGNRTRPADNRPASRAA